MGVGTGRLNRRTSDSRETRQMALQQPPPVVTTWVKVTTAAQIPNELGLWAARNPQQAPQRQMTFPSDLASRRSVGTGRYGSSSAHPPKPSRLMTTTWFPGAAGRDCGPCA